MAAISSTGEEFRGQLLTYARTIGNIGIKLQMSRKPINITEYFYNATKNGGGSINLVLAENRSEKRTVPELFRNIFRLSKALSSSNFKNGDAVLILTGNSIETVEILLSCFNAGCVAVPLSVLSGLDYIKEAAKRLKPRCIFFRSGLQEAVVTSIDDDNVLLIDIDEDCDKRGAVVHLSEFIEGSDGSPAFVPVEEDIPALIIHTSGSEGRPKLVEFTQGAFLRYFAIHDKVYSQYFAEDNLGGPILSVFPFNHFAGILVSFQGLYMGKDTFLFNSFDPDLFIKTVAKVRAEFISLVASMYHRIVNNTSLINSLDLSNLKIALALGEPCPYALADTIERTLNAYVMCAYGMTECFSGIAHHKEDIKARNIPRNSCGKDFYGDLRLEDVNGNVNPEIGFLRIRNETVYECYKDESLNREFIVDGWFKTKDYLYKDDAGHYYYRGRGDDMFICNGKNIYPAELERVVLSHPSIVQSCVVPLSIEGKTCLGLVLTAREKISEEEVYDFLVGNAPSHTIPRRLLIVERLPEVGPGKIDRKACEKLINESLQ